MSELISEYPKAIAAFIIGGVVTYATGKVPEEMLSPAVVQAAQVIVAAIAYSIFGKFTRLSKTEAKEFKEMQN